jgi:uracil phosphoribosyltransferase
LVAQSQVLADLVVRGADPANIRVVAVVAAPPALKKMADTYPGASHVATPSLPYFNSAEVI